MQPTYLPWAGYFNLIKSVDYFVFLDDVQLEKQSWQTRNQYILGCEKKYITIPISKSSKLNTPLTQIYFAKNTFSWQKKSYRKLQAAYNNSNYGDILLKDIYRFFHDESFFQYSLAEYNIELIMFFCKKLGIDTKIYRSSEMDFFDKRSSYIALILDNLQCDTYLSPIGAKKYLYEDRFDNISNANLIFQNYIPDQYKQKNCSQFIGSLSIIDVIANIGYQNCKGYIK